MKNISIIVIFGGAALVVSGVAFAANEGGCFAPPPHIERFFQDADSNRDGLVTREEFKAFNETIYHAADMNRDGAIDHNEWVSHHDKKHREMDQNER